MRMILDQVQALLHDYLIDEQNEGATSRSATASINDVLRLGRVARDPRKALFKFGDSDAKAASRRIKPFEDSLNKALKSSVPGLVSSLAEGRSADIGLANASSAIFNSTFGLPNGGDGNAAPGTGGAGGSNVVGRTHRMLVPPNSFKIEKLALPALKFLERVKENVPEVEATAQSGNGNATVGALEPASSDLARRCSGLMDEQTLERLRPALNEELQLTIGSTALRVNGSSSSNNSNNNVTEAAMAMT